MARRLGGGHQQRQRRRPLSARVARVVVVDRRYAPGVYIFIVLLLSIEAFLYFEKNELKINQKIIPKIPKKVQIYSPLIYNSNAELGKI